MCLTVGVRSVLRCDTKHIYSQAYSQQRTLTQHYMLPQHATDIRGLINECFYNDFSKEQCSSLRMILGSKYVGAILKVSI